MPTIRVQFYGMIRDLVAESTMVIEVDEDTTLADVLQMLVARCGPSLQHALMDEAGRVQRSVCLSVNDVIVSAAALKEPLCPDTSTATEVSLLVIPPVFGGGYAKDIGEGL